MTWHTDALPVATLDALDFFSSAAWLAGVQWYLAGGTALALQVGHRRSVDLDFFSREHFALNAVLGHLTEKDWQTQRATEGTVYGICRGAMVSFIAYPFFIPQEPVLHYGKVSVLAKRDIATMKIIAISQRGRKRDFLDLYWYSLHEESLNTVMRRLPEQYPSVAHDYHHILKSMLYFDDAENDPMPETFFKADWSAIKTYFLREVPKVAKEVLGLER